VSTALSTEPATPSALKGVLDQSEHAEDLVGECVVEISTANGGLQGELAAGPPSVGVQQALEQTVAVEEKLELVSGELAAVNAALQQEVKERAERESALTAAAEEATERLAAIVESSDDAIISKDMEGLVTSWNGGAERIFGYTAAEMVGRSILVLIPEDRRDEEALILASIGRGESVEHFETQRMTRDGRSLHVSITASPIRDAGGAVVGVSKIARDMSAMVADSLAERDLLKALLAHSIEQGEAGRRAALHDPLTGLPNRSLFADRLEHGLAQARRHGWTLAVMFLDLDGFKQVNDTHGHDVGDVVLRTIAGRLKHHTRSDDTICRFGGDEFVYLLMEVADGPAAARIADHLLRVTREPCAVGVRGLDLSLSLHASIGIALFPRDGETPEALIASADQAMYVAKRTHAGYAFHA
jgi:diguanylate cyclase (GGDEF)-like protein/PAS domain S-box-containing protein